MKEIFNAVEDLHLRKPGIDHTEEWYASKLAVEESWEFVAAVANHDPKEIVAEGSDIIMLVVDSYLKAGISPEVAMVGLLEKINELVGRPDESFKREIGSPRADQLDKYTHPY